MIEKQVIFRGQTEAGIFAQAVFGRGMEKTAEPLDYIDNWDTQDQIRSFVRQVTPRDQDRYCFVLVNALGAGEYYGSNINSDYFGWPALSHEGTDYGYKTFLDANAFQHHKNKDPSRAFGVPMLSMLNPRMKRVELIIKLDRDKADAEGAGSVIQRIDAGEFPDVSMGCAPKGSPVLLADGRYVPIETVRDGDLVVSHRGLARRVVNTMVRPHKGEIFHIKAYGTKDPLVLTEEHPLWLLRAEQVACRPSTPTINNGRKQQVCVPDSPSLKKGCEGCETKPGTEFAWVRADEAQVGDYLATPLPSFDTSRSFSSDEARLLGYYLSEGLILRTKAGSLMAVQFCTGLHETETHAEIFAAANRLGFESVSELDVEERNGKYITIYDKGFAALCLEHCGEKSKTKSLSSSLMGASEDTLQNFLGSYANGDGGCYKGSIYLSTASEQLAKQLRIVLLRCRMMASVNVIQHKPGPKSVVKKETTEYQVWIGTDSAWKFIGSRHAPERSKKLCSKRFFVDHEGVSYLVTPIESIERVDYDDQVYNFGVEEDNSYLMDGLAVHNCKVPYDVCSICNHKSKTRNDYCEHMRPPEHLRHIYGPNKILADGRRIFVHNLHPRFFDISFVFIGADKTAKVMAKLAQKGEELCIGSVCALPTNRPESIELYGARGELLDVGQLRKTASSASEVGCDGQRGPCGRLCSSCNERDVCSTDKLASGFGIKQASHKKTSEIEKKIPADSFAARKLPLLERSEPDISKPDLDSLAKRPLSGVLGSATRVGIILKPHEFQHIVLRRMGEDDLLETLDRDHKVFRETPEFGTGSIDTSLDEVFSLLKKYIKQRTAIGTPFQIRVMIAGKGTKNALPTRKPIGHSLLDKVSAAYNSYRREVLEKFAQVVSDVKSDPRLVEELLGDGLSMMFKTASDEIVSTDSVKYLLGAHFQNRSLLTNSVAGAATIDNANLTTEILNPA